MGSATPAATEGPPHSVPSCTRTTAAACAVRPCAGGPLVGRHIRARETSHSLRGWRLRASVSRRARSLAPACGRPATSPSAPAVSHREGEPSIRQRFGVGLSHRPVGDGGSCRRAGTTGLFRPAAVRLSHGAGHADDVVAQRAAGAGHAVDVTAWRVDDLVAKAAHKARRSVWNGGWTRTATRPSKARGALHPDPDRARGTRGEARSRPESGGRQRRRRHVEVGMEPARAR